MYVWFHADCNLAFLFCRKIEIEATSFEVFKAFIVYLYTDEIHIDIDYVEGGYTCISFTLCVFVCVCVCVCVCV